MIINKIYKHPEYFFRPRNILKRFINLDRIKEHRIVKLPWGKKINVNPDESLGKSIIKYGIYDLALSEVLWRLTDPNDTAVDVGSNIGYTTNLLDHRINRDGRIISIEPHPELFIMLKKNVALLDSNNKKKIFLENLALSDYIGYGFLMNYRDKNQGTAYLIEEKINKENEFYKVEVKTLEEILIKYKINGLNILKIDVEGLEYKVLKGATSYLKKRSIRDILFEDNKYYHTPIKNILNDYKILTENGYKLFIIEKSFLKPKLVEIGDTNICQNNWEPLNFLATQNPIRAIQRVNSYGWYSLY